MSSKKSYPLKFGDPRTFAEATTTETAKFLDGTEYPVGTVISISSSATINGQEVTFTLPSMAEIIFAQAHKDLDKAAKLKSKALQYSVANNARRIINEDLFFVYLQLCCSGVLGVYAALEAMVHELHIRRMDKKIIIEGKELDSNKLSNEGFERKVTSIASQLSGKENIFTLPLMKRVKALHKLRISIQHWNQPISHNYFLSLPESHPIKALINTNPLIISSTGREVLDHYSLMEKKI